MVIVVLARREVRGFVVVGLRQLEELHHDSSPALQLGQNKPWFRDLNVSYHVGMYAFSVWLVGMTEIVMASCIIYGWRVGRTRPRAYFAR
jgi:NADH:ubiquinone oxidoreductase subunit 4 (subunit M)